MICECVFIGGGGGDLHGVTFIRCASDVKVNTTIDATARNDPVACSSIVANQ